MRLYWRMRFAVPPTVIPTEVEGPPRRSESHQPTFSPFVHLNEVQHAAQRPPRHENTITLG